MIRIPERQKEHVDPIEPIAVDSTQAAKLISVSPRTLHQLTKDGKIQVKRIGRKLLYGVAELKRFINEK